MVTNCDLHNVVLHWNESCSSGLGNPERELFLKLNLHKSIVLASYYLKFQIPNNCENCLSSNFQGHLTWTLVLLEDCRQKCWLTSSVISSKSHCQSLTFCLQCFYWTIWFCSKSTEHVPASSI